MIMSPLGQGNASFTVKDSTLIQILKISENKELQTEKQSAKTAKAGIPVQKLDSASLYCINLVRSPFMHFTL